MQHYKIDGGYFYINWDENSTERFPIMYKYGGVRLVVFATDRLARKVVTKIEALANGAALFGPDDFVGDLGGSKLTGVTVSAMTVALGIVQGGAYA